MKRVIWFGLGIAVTVVAAGYVARTHERFQAVSAVSSPAGIGEQIGQLAVAVRDVADEFRRTMHEHEQALTETLLGDPAEKKPTQRPLSQDPYDPTAENLDDIDRYF